MAPVLFFSIEGNSPDINVVGTILMCMYRECFMLRQMKGNFVKNREVISKRVSPGQTGCRPIEARTYQADICPTSSFPTNPSTAS